MFPIISATNKLLTKINQLEILVNNVLCKCRYNCTLKTFAYFGTLCAKTYPTVAIDFNKIAY